MSRVWYDNTIVPSLILLIQLMREPSILNVANDAFASEPFTAFDSNQLSSTSVFNSDEGLVDLNTSSN